jgi:hypothetical protein
MKYILLASLALWSWTISAQEAIKVFYTRGELKVIQNKTEKPCTRGMNLTSGTLVVPEGGIVILVSSEGQNLKISDAGSYDYKSLIKLYKSTEGNLTQDYFKYVWSQISEGDSDKKVAEVRTAVYRGDIAMFLPPDSTVIYSQQVPFTWKGGNEKQYFYIWSEDQKLVAFQTSDSMLTMDMDAFVFEPGVHYQWEVATTNPPPSNLPKNTFRVLSGREAKDLDAELKTFESQISEYPEEVQYAMKAAFYAERKMYMMAIQHFEIGMYIAEDKAFIEDLYAEFLNRVMNLD